jgi:hypothetical protein
MHVAAIVGRDPRVTRDVASLQIAEQCRCCNNVRGASCRIADDVGVVHERVVLLQYSPESAVAHATGIVSMYARHVRPDCST